MAEGIPDISETLGIIRERASRQKTLKGILGNPTDSENRLLDKVKGKSTIRSEFIIVPEQVDQLNSQIEQTRDILIKKGKDGTDDSFAASSVGEPGESTLEQLKNYRTEGSMDDGMQVWGYEDLSDPEKIFESDESMARLSFAIYDPEMQIELHFGLNGEYRLNIDFFNKNATKERHAGGYFSGEKPLSDMTPEEFQIAEYCIARYQTSA